MKIEIINSKLQYKANDGGVTRRIPDHFFKRSVLFEVDGEARRIDIDKKTLPISATEEQIIAHILENLPESTAVNEEIKKLQELTERVKTATEIYEENVDKMDILIEDLKVLRIGKLKEECSQAIYDGFFVGENRFGFNEHDQANFTQQLLLVVAGQSSPIHWKTKNKGVIELTADEFKAVCQAAEAHKRTEQEKYWTLEQKILAATTEEEVKAVEW